MTESAVGRPGTAVLDRADPAVPDEVGTTGPDRAGTAGPTRPLRLRGRPPYGYQVLRPAEGSGGVIRLEPDLASAPVVRRIFAEYVTGSGLQAIAEGLTSDSVSCPSAHDPSRNPHHDGVAWSKGAVRAILVNRRYAGGEAGGYPPLVEADVYDRAQQAFAARRRGQARQDGADRVYVFRGLLRCGSCRRLMQGTWNNDEPYYRCRFPEKYASANRIAHPRNVYLRESRLLGPLDSWLAAACSPRQIGAQLHSATDAGAPGGYLEVLGRQLRASGDGTPAERARLYSWLGLRLIYSPTDPTVQAKVVLGRQRLVVTGQVPL